ncbi:MAG: hypothetical protein R6X35_01350 [Candidatus Krumholzibacteriia bacterium]
MKHAAILVTILALGVLAAGGALAQTQAVNFHWAPSPDADGQGNPLPEAVGYQVWLRRDADLPQQVATVMGDTVYTLQAEPGVVQRIRVCGFDSQGRVSPYSEWSDPVYFEGEVRGGDGVPGAGALGGNYPNPFNPETRIRYGVPEDLATGDPLRLEIYGIDGRRVRAFPVDRTPGWHEVTWDGTDDRGVVQSTGMYVTRLVVGTRVETGKMTMLK